MGKNEDRSKEFCVIDLATNWVIHHVTICQDNSIMFRSVRKAGLNQSLSRKYANSWYIFPSFEYYKDCLDELRWPEYCCLSILNWTAEKIFLFSTVCFYFSWPAVTVLNIFNISVNYYFLFTGPEEAFWQGMEGLWNKIVSTSQNNRRNK